MVSFFDITDAEFPILVRLVDAGEETFALLVIGKMEKELDASAQLFNRYPVLNIQPTTARHSVKNPSVIARLTSTLTSDDS